MRTAPGLVIVALGVVALVGMVGMVALAWAGRPVDGLTPLVATAVGALASILARTTGEPGSQTHDPAWRKE